MAVATTNPGGTLTGHVYVDGLIWGNSWDVNTNVGGPAGTITYSFGNNSVSAFKNMSNFEKQAFRKALDLIETFIPVTFVEVPFLTPQGANYENISWGLVADDFFGSPGVLGAHQVPGDKPLLQDDFGINTLFGFFNYETPLFAPAALGRGGEGFATIVHEILHGLGLAHPHDNGGGSSVFPGVTGEFGDYGTDGQNQAIFTIMSYNSGYPQVMPLPSNNFGGVGGPMALDIAALQAIYGTKAHNTGNNVYSLKGANAAGTFWQAIWDTGGNDTISAAGLWKGVKINLKAADLEGHDAGGSPSHAFGVSGGFTIANGVVIENAIGGHAGDFLYGNSSANYIAGNGGNDVISSDGGNDIVRGGNGNDSLNGGLGNDDISGGQGWDKFIAKNGDGNDLIAGGEGTDTLVFTGTAAASVNLSITTAQNTGYGNDTISGIENLSGTAQGDQFTGNASANTFYGYNGDDTLNGLDGVDTLYGGGGNDTISGGLGWDVIRGGLGNDTISGDNGWDNIISGDGDDNISGGNGWDTIDAGIGNDQVSGGDGSDTIYTGDGNDDVTGGNGADTIWAGRGADTISGGDGDDKIYGRRGADTVTGGEGLDIMGGGNGTDTFVFNAVTDSGDRGKLADVITDFTQGQDKIDLSAIDANATLSGDQEFVFNGTSPISTSDDGEIYYIKQDYANSALDQTIVFIDTDGDSEPEMVIKLKGAIDLTADDFIL